MSKPITKKSVCGIVTETLEKMQVKGWDFVKGGIVKDAKDRVYYVIGTLDCEVMDMGFVITVSFDGKIVRMCCDGIM